MISKGSWTAVRIMILILTIAAIAGGTAYAASAVSKNKLLEIENAEEFARLDAGVSPEDITVTQTELKKKDGKYIYNITFYAGNTLYQYKISADDGTILAKDKAVEDEDQPANSNDASANSKDDPAGTNGQTAGTDQDTMAVSDGTPKTDQSLVTNQTSATEADGTKETNQTSATVTDGTPKTDNKPLTDDDSSTGSKDRQTSETASQDQKPQSKSYISVDQARRIALEHAGFTENEVRFTKAMFENDDEDGEEFEIEFYVGNVEYDYDISALTGKILDFSKEIDD